MAFLCKIGKHKWDSNYDPMYERYTRVCLMCGKEQIGFERIVTVKYKNKENDKSRCKNKSD